MASKSNSGGNTGTVNVSQLVSAANSAQSTAQQDLLSARENIVGQLEGLSGDLTTIDSTLGTMGFDGSLPAPNLSGSAVSIPKRQGRPRKSSAAPVAEGARGPKNMPLEDSICHALDQSEAGGVGGEGLSLAQVVVACQAEPVGYAFSGSPANHKAIISQRMGGDEGLIGTGYVEQIPMEGRSRGLPYRLTSFGRTWVKSNAIG